MDNSLDLAGIGGKLLSGLSLSGLLTRDRDFSGCSGRGFGSLNN